MTDNRVTDRRVAELGQQIRVKVCAGTGVPLVLCNGIGVSLDVLDPLVDHLNRDTTVVRFDAPGTGGSSDSPVPYGFPYLVTMLGRLLRRLGLKCPVDVLGFSWGGALAQQFAFRNPRRCRRLILASTATGAIMVPGKPSVLAKMLTRRRFLDHDHGAAIAGGLYGGARRAGNGSANTSSGNKLTPMRRSKRRHSVGLQKMNQPGIGLTHRRAAVAGQAVTDLWPGISILVAATLFGVYPLVSTLSSRFPAPARHSCGQADQA